MGMGKPVEAGRALGRRWIFSRRPRLVVIAVLAALVAGAGVATGVLLVVRGGGGGGVAIRLNPAGKEQIDGFMPPVGQDVVVKPTSRCPAGATRAPSAAICAPLTAAPSAGPTGSTGSTQRSGGAVPAEAVGLYGANRREAGCDKSRLAGFLAANPTLAAEWARTLGISVGDIPRYVDSLTPVVLREDTLVTNHGFKNGKATSFPAVLQAGTAVFVDQFGTPVVKCSCGNPLTSTHLDAKTLAGSRLEGPRWDGFAPQTVINIVPATVRIEILVVVDLAAQDAFARPAGSAGERDHEYVPAAQTDWRNTTLKASCADGTTVTLVNGAAQTTGPAGTTQINAAAIRTGELVAGSTADEAAVLLRCRRQDAGTEASVVQVYRDGPNLLATIEPPAIDGQAGLGFAADPFQVDDGALITVVDYPRPAEPGKLIRRTLAWRWESSRFTYRVTAEEETAMPPGVPGLTVRPAADAVEVSITAPIDGGPVTSYQITASNGQNRTLDQLGQITIPVTGCQLVIVTATATGLGGTSPTTNPAQARGCIRPGPVRNLQIGSGAGPTGGVVDVISWQPPANPGGGTLTYTVTRYYQGTPTSYDTSETSLRLGQTGGTNRFDYISVAAKNQAGEGPESRTTR